MRRVGDDDAKVVQQALSYLAKLGDAGQLQGTVAAPLSLLDACLRVLGPAADPLMPAAPAPASAMPKKTRVQAMRFMACQLASSFAECGAAVAAALLPQLQPTAHTRDIAAAAPAALASMAGWDLFSKLDKVEASFNARTESPKPAKAGKKSPKKVPTPVGHVASWKKVCVCFDQSRYVGNGGLACPSARPSARPAGMPRTHTHTEERTHACLIVRSGRLWRRIRRRPTARPRPISCCVLRRTSRPTLPHAAVRWRTLSVWCS